jgi:hypothetical protein
MVSEEKFHGANGKAQACTQGALLLFLLSWGREEVFFKFSPGSQFVPIIFPLSSQYVPQVPHVFPNMFSIAPHFYPMCFDKCCPPFTYIPGPKGQKPILQNRSIYFGTPPEFQFLGVMGQSNWLVGEKKIELGRHII